MNIKSRKNKIDTFEDYVLRYYGPSLYNVFFKDYTQKFLGISSDKVHSEWAKEGMKRTIIDERMASRNLFDILKLSFNFKPLRTKFIYPRKGIGVFCERLAEEIREHGGEIRTHADIAHIRYSAERIEEVFLKELSIEPEVVIWTGSLGAICNLSGLPCNGLKYLSLLAFNIEVDKPINRKFQWCYYGSRDIIFSRVTIPSSFSEHMAPEHSIGLCVEVTCHEGDVRWNNPELLSERVKKDLIKVGLIGRIEDIRYIYIEKIRDAYPIYTSNYQRDLEKIKDNLSKFKNLILAGRTGLFWYNNMDNSIENGLEVIKTIIQRAQ
jgi:protoporphyrinogen oxidase